MQTIVQKDIEIIGLKQDVLDRISNDPLLQGLVADKLKRSVATVLRMVGLNDPALTQAAPLKAMAAHLGVQNTDELLEMQTVEEKLTND